MNELGIVTNCWQYQLGQGVPLERLLDQAVEHGLTSIELRQSALGDLEADAGRAPDVTRLRRLAERYPQCSFDYAMSIDFLSGGVAADPGMVSRGREAAIATAVGGVPHLRLVDLGTPAGTAMVPGPSEVESLIDLVISMQQAGGILSLENCRQPWAILLHFIEQLWQGLGDHRERLKICFDPANFGLSTEAGDPRQALAQLAATDLSMVHLKQVALGVVQQELNAGEIDWCMHLKQLRDKQYQGPFLFEMAAGPECWPRFERARCFYERACGDARQEA